MTATQMIIDNREYVFRIDNRDFHCAMDVAMKYVGGKWKSIILWYLIKTPKRFSELKRRIPGITEKMLSLQLDELESDGLVNRTVHNSKPPLKVVYTLSDFGQTMVPMLEEIAKWGRSTGSRLGEMVRLEQNH